ncbi:hypothetical protein [Poseidonocella sp. HB161398]|nr:hypothetical protein [Poseidonocella sp. HB161398]
MTRKTDPETEKPVPPSKEDRLKAALKANLQRRKAQAKARQAPEENED